MFLSKRFLYVMLFISSLFNVGCKKSNPEPTDSSIELSATKSKYASFEIMEIEANSPIFGSGDLSANIGNVQLTITTDNNKAYVLLPRLTDGLHELNFQLGAKNYVVKFNILNLVGIPFPDAYIQLASQQILSSISFIEQQIDSLQAQGVPPSELNALTQDLARYNQIFQDQVAAFNQLTPSEKGDFAAFMAVNQPLMDSLRVLNAPLSSSIDVLRTAQQIPDFEDDVEISESKFYKKVIVTVAHIPLVYASFHLVSVPNPWVSAGGAIAAVVLTTDFILEIDKTATMGKRLVNSRIKPFNFFSPNVNSFLNDQETDVDVNADYRNVIETDPNNRTQNNENGPVIQRIANYYKGLKTTYERLVGLLPSLLRPTYVVAPLPANSTTQKRAVFNEYIQISNCNNPNVTLTQIDQADGSIKLKASTTLNGTQNFSYDIEYLNTDFTTNLKKTVNASVTNGSPCPNALGTYQVKNIFVGNSGTYDWGYMILLADGTGKYRLSTETNFTTFTYTSQSCFIDLRNLFGCSQPNVLTGFYYNGNSTYTWTNTCSSVYRSHVFYKQ